MTDSEFLRVIQANPTAPGGRLTPEKEAAWTWFHKHYALRIRQVVVRHFHGCGADVDEVSEGILVALYGNLPVASLRSPLPNYVAGVARRKAREAESRRRSGNRRGTWLTPEREAQLVAPNSDQVALYRRIESIKEVHALRLKLPQIVGERNSKIIEGRVFGGSTVGQVAAQMGLTIASVQNRWSRAMKKLRNHLRGSATDPTAAS
jgi:RNA polymerase sigma factor (sigma-70 family)